MTLSSGMQLGPYQILSPLGAGGMGEVYRARDRKLDRDVAIKVLPDTFARDPERVARFQREAKVLASLNHPNIAAIYGFEMESGEAPSTDDSSRRLKPAARAGSDLHFLILELVEGETLAERLHGSALPVDEALEVCKQIAEALEAAHEHSVIHRDLKPANVKVTPDGMVKVLDFGLAKAFVGDASGAALADSPTITVEHTRPGVVLGTAAYMSPEQARGKPLDKRTDIWSFGCVLYECLTDQRPFDGDTTTDVLAKILERDPDYEALPVTTPPPVRVLLRRCLQKDRKRRLHDIGDARIELDEVMSELPSSGASPAPGVGNGRSWWRSPPVWAAIGLAAGLTTSAFLFRGSVTSTPASKPSVTKRSIIELPASAPLALSGAALLALARPSLALSPDGSRLVYAADLGETTQLYLRPLDRFEATPIPGTEGAFNPFFSPDGSRVGFFTRDKLRTVSLRGGEPVTLCDARDALSGSTWGEDGMIYFLHQTRRLVRVSVAGGDAQEVRSSDGRNYWWSSPHSLPGGTGLLLTCSAMTSFSFDHANIVHFSLETGVVKTLIEGGYHARYIPTGHLVFVRGGGLFAAPFDLDRLEVTGASVHILDRVWTDSLWGPAQFSFSDDGSLIYAAGGDWARTIPTWLDRQGKEEEALPLPPQIYGTFKLSHGAERLAIQVIGFKDQIYTFDSVRGTFSRASLQGGNMWPVWTADGTRVVFASSREGKRGFRLYWKSVDGSDAAEPLMHDASEPGSGNYFPTSVSPDGRLLAFSHYRSIHSVDLWVLRLDGDREAQPFLLTEYVEWGAVFSPDGRWLAFTSDKTGRSEVFVWPYPENDREWQVSDGGGEEPVWSPRGDELFYRNGTKLMAVAVSKESGFHPGPPRVLLEAQFHNSPGPSYDVSPDGKRFLVNKPVVPETPMTKLRLVANWFEELKAKVPTGK